MKHLLISTALLFNITALAQAADYSPDIANFDGKTNYAFAPSTQIDLSDGGAVEFWVAPAWKTDLAYDAPVIINAGTQGVSYLISVLRDRKGLVFASGENEDVFVVDLSDGQLHHVAVNIVKDGVIVYVDGKIVGTSTLRPLQMPSSGLFVGGLEGENTNKFIGAIGQLRLWDEALLIEDIRAFSFADVVTGNGTGHPDLKYLSAISNFKAGELLLVESVEPIQ